MRQKLSKAQREMLQVLSCGPRGDFTDESIVKALSRQGLAERYSDSLRFINTRHSWRITDAGRAKLSECP